MRTAKQTSNNAGDMAAAAAATEEMLKKVRARLRKIDVDYYKELGINRAWTCKEIKKYLGGQLRDNQGKICSCQDMEQKLALDELRDLITAALTNLTKEQKRADYDMALDEAYKSGRIVDKVDEEYKSTLEKANAYYRKGNIRLAHEFAQQVVDGGLMDAEAYKLLARCCALEGNESQALAVLDQGLKLFNDDISVHWLGARIATYRMKNFDEAQRRINVMLELFPNRPDGYAEQIYMHLRKGDEQLAFQEIDSYIAKNPDDEHFKRVVAYDLDDYADSFYYEDKAADTTYIADKVSYDKCLTMCMKAHEIYDDAYTRKRLESAKYYGKREWNDWNLPSIRALAIYGGGFLLYGCADTTGVFMSIGVILYAIMGLLIYYSFRPYWQINQTYVTGKMGTAEKAISNIGEYAGRFAKWLFFAIIRFIIWFFKWLGIIMLRLMR